NTDLESMLADALLPPSNQLFLGFKVRNLVGYRREVRMESKRQAHQGTLEVISSIFSYCVDHLHFFGQRPQQAKQFRRGEKSDFGLAFHQQRQIPNELDNISEALFGKDEQATPPHLLPSPWRGIHIRALAWKLLRIPAPFVILPAVFVLTR